jgi:DNA-binding beta-propeller fold protein YncE
VARTTGSAVALSRDERIAVVTNRSAGSVTVFSLTSGPAGVPPMIVRSFDTGADSEPWQAVIGLDDDTAYVLFRNSQSVRRVSHLHAAPALEDSGVSVGSEPSALAISPSGQKLFVANWGDGTVSVITTSDFQAQVKIDLNQALVDTGVLGAVTARLALAHPRALAMTDNGDESDLDETLYATEFFSQPLPGVQAPADFSEVDRNRQGFVYPISLRTGQPGAAIPIAPVLATGFVDGEGRMTSCFPNQLSALAVDHDRLYMTSLCTSPRGPLGPKAKDGSPTDNNWKTLFHPAVFVIDTTTNQEVPAQGQLLSRVLDGYYQAGGEDPVDERMPLSPNDIAFASSGPAGSHAYVSALGADAVYRLDYDAAGTLQAIGDPGARYIDVQSNHGLPVGLALSKLSAPPFALVVSDAALYLSVINLETGGVSVVDAHADPTFADTFRHSDRSQGRGFFGTGRDLWSFKGQAWSSCEGCHPGGLSDGVTWFFARGPRRTLSTAGTYEKSPDVANRARRLLLWGANIDELHDVEAIVRGVSGGVGAALWGYTTEGATNDCRLVYDGSAPVSSGQEPCVGSKPTSYLENGLNGSLAGLDTGTHCRFVDSSCDTDGLPDWRMIDAFIRAERAPRAPPQCGAGETEGCLSPSDVAAGQGLFKQGGCAGCHGGPGFTVSKLFYTPGAPQNGMLPYAPPVSAADLQLGALRTGEYRVSPELWPLNPAARAGGGLASFRALAPAGASDADTVAYYYGTPNAAGSKSTPADDQIRCALRDVGTFPEQPTVPPGNFLGVAPVGGPVIYEKRQDMSSLAQGQSGFNVPPLFGLSVGAPFFHAGNARTLEELFDSATFARHHQALAPGFLADPATRDAQVAQLVAYLLAIDESTTLEPIPTTNAQGAPTNYDFCQSR